MPYDAITIDSNTVFHNGFHFEGGMLGQLRQFKDAPTKFILSQVVGREIERHIVAKSKAARDGLDGALRKAGEYGLLSEAGQQLLGEPESLPVPRDAARRRLASFIVDSGCTVIPADLASMSDLVKLYFAPSPPFEPAGKKKAEFPDAIALLSLQQWANDNNAKLLAVSADEGWARFAEGSQCIDVVTDLGEALKLLQTHTDQASQFVQAKINSIRNEPDAPLAQEFVARLKTAIGDAVPYGSAEAGYAVEVDSVDLEYRGYSFISEPEDDPFDVVQAGAHKLVARAALLIDVYARASLSFDIWDSIDREHVTIGGAHAAIETDIEADVLITLEGDWSAAPGEVSVTSVELVEVPDIDLGYVEPDYGDPDEYEDHN